MNEKIEEGPGAAPSSDLPALEKLLKRDGQNIAAVIMEPIMLNNKVASLRGVVESADTAPTDQSYEVFQLLSTRVNEQLFKLDTTVKTQLPQVNQMLQKQKLEPIKAEPMKREDGKEKPKSNPQ